MARAGTVAYILYATKDKELQEAFEKVQKHFGKTYSVSGVLADLVKRKAEEIDSKATRRDQIAGLREDIKALEARLDEQSEYIVFLGEIVRALMAKGMTPQGIADLFACGIEMLPDFIDAHAAGEGRG